MKLGDVNFPKLFVLEAFEALQRSSFKVEKGSC
jgi:hypothetical protein